MVVEGRDVRFKRGNQRSIFGIHTLFQNPRERPERHASLSLTLLRNVKDGRARFGFEIASQRP
ncbi:MAG: hypothetical protein EDS66_09675 [Planctomycetota bacterium]|nr:MAG: hypothetical protein EDS66_09675 [Planctomycetota bacterium]MCQ3921987.1 hypothetical protein [Planctomycetota bacterium]